VIGCKQENYLQPEIFYNRVLISEDGGRYPVVSKKMFPVQCNHCSEPPCVEVCPTGASHQRQDGIVLVDYDKCVGCRSCRIACPYQARTYLAEEKEYFPDQGLTPLEVIAKKLRTYQIGVAQKCTFCVERIDNGLKQGLKPGTDREATPACVIACPTKTRVFGDLDDPNSEVSQLIREKRAAAFHDEHGTGPSIYYIIR
jgi:phenylacetyl-CoA:acceptor oxidoreductase subunit 1